MHKYKGFGFFKILIFLGVSLAVGGGGVVPSNAHPTDPITENGYNLATVTPRPYNGTPYVDVTAIVFASVFIGDEVFATADGELSSRNAGYYNRVTIRNIVATGADAENYQFPDVAVMPTDVTISKVAPVLELTTTPSGSIAAEEEFIVTVRITNDFDYPDGLPTAAQIGINVTNASLKPGTTIQKTGNTYTATYLVAANTGGEKVAITASVSPDATNYSEGRKTIEFTVAGSPAPTQPPTIAPTQPPTPPAGQAPAGSNAGQGGRLPVTGVNDFATEGVILALGSLVLMLIAARKVAFRKN